MENNRVKELTFGSLMIALVFVTTFSVKIPVPFTQGYIHAGDSMIFIAGVLLGWRQGALAGGIGSALADILGGYSNWALPTLLIKGIMGGLVGWITHDVSKKSGKGNIFLGIFSALSWFAFIFLVKGVLSKALNHNGHLLIGKIEGITSVESLFVQGAGLQSQLLWAAVILPSLLLIISLASKKNARFLTVNQLLGILVAGLWMVTGYYLAAGIMYGSFIVPIFSMPWNILQFIGGGTIAYFILLALKKTPLEEYFK